MYVYGLFSPITLLSRVRSLNTFKVILIRMDSTNENVTLSFLLSGTNNCLPPFYLKLRSYLNVCCSNVAGYFGLKLPKSLTNKNTSCPFCFTPWTQNTVSFKLFPSPRKRKKESSNDQNKAEDTIYSRNKLVLQCKLCTKKSSFSLIKKKNVEKKLKQLSTDSSVRKKKKRKDKNKHSGLKLPPDEKVKKYNASVLKNKQKSSKSSNPNKVKSCGKATTRNFEKQIKPVKKETNIGNGATGNSIVTNKNMKTQLVINPKALLNQSKAKKKNGKRLKHLKKAIGQEKTTVKTTLKDFLTLVNK